MHGTPPSSTPRSRAARAAARSLLALLLALGLVGAARLAEGRFAGVLTGIVSDPEGVGIADALVELEGTAHRTVTDGSGAFLLDSIPAGAYPLLVAREGYRPARATVRVPGDSAVQVAITLVPEGRPLERVRVEARRRNALTGTVVDAEARPMAGTPVAVVGSGRTVTTDSLGRFAFADLPTGAYLVEARRLGFELARHPVRMVDGIERDVTLQLRRGERALTAIELHNVALAAREAHSRRAQRSLTMSLVLGREELDRWGRTGLEIVLEHSSLREEYVKVPHDQYCVLVDGVRPLGRGVLSLGAANQATGASLITGGQSAPAGEPSDGWLRTFFADQVHMVELFAAGADHSRSVCGRFGSGTGCACDPGRPTPPTVVVWMRN